MKITMVTIHFPPEIGGGVHLGYELARKLKHLGHDVHVLTGYPQYNVKKLPKRYRKGCLMSEQYRGLSVTRIRFPSFPRGSKIAKGFQHLSYGFFLGILALVSIRSGLIVTYSPPLPMPWILCWIAKLKGLPVVVSVQDLFPIEAVELGMLTNPILIWLFEGMERQMYRGATRIAVHSPGNVEHIVKHGAKSENVDVIYNWVDTKRINPGPRKNSFSNQYGLSERFVVSYAGTMGWAQDMDTIVESAARVQDDPAIIFLLVGDGVEKHKAIEKGWQYGLKNIIWLPMQPWDIYPSILAASDVCMINLHPALKTPVVPSKLISIMAAARPVIASLPAESDARALISAADCGLIANAGDAAALAHAIRTLASQPNLCKQYGHQGLQYVNTHFTENICIRKMESVLRKAYTTRDYSFINTECEVH